jgi:hypothetical protein
MESLKDLLRRELAPEAEALSSLLQSEFGIRPDPKRSYHDYVFEIESELPGVSKPGK